MATHSRSKVLKFLSLAWLVAFSMPTLAQTILDQRQSNADHKESSKVSEADLLEAGRRTFAISSVTSLADEARSYQDLTLRARVLARAADTLWEVDGAKARPLFRSAWEAAEKADAQDPVAKTKDSPPPMVTALRRMSGRDLRMEVLSLAARRDRAFGEEFLTKLKDENTRASNDSKNDTSTRMTDSWTVSEQVSKRLLLARGLIEDGQVELALGIATPVLNEVNVQSIGFLSQLREKKPAVADERFVLLLACAELDPSSDANTVSGLSSYVYTPGFFVTFSPDGGSRWTQPDGTAATPPNLPATVHNRFLQVAASILLRPSPPPSQDFSSTGRLGKYMVIKRLLPFFESAAPETAAGLRAQLPALANDLPRTAIREETSRLNQFINPEGKAANPLQRMQDQLDRANSSRERDEIYADASVALSHHGESRAKDLADKIEDSSRRSQVQQYVDFQFIQVAIKKKEPFEVARLARSGQLTHTQRVWAYTQAAKLLMNSERALSIELLGEAAEEARRVNADDPDRARSLIAVARQFVTADQVRSWEILGEAVKAANSVEKFTGENEHLTFSMLMTRSGVKITSVRAEDFGLSGLIRALAEADLNRTADLTKGFKNAAPRATATLAIANTVLTKRVSSSRATRF